MTNPSTNLVIVEPRHRPEQLAEGVVRALSRPMSPRLSWGPMQTLLLGLFSGGLLPLVWLSKRFGDFINAEQTHLWHFTEWLRLQLPGPDAERLHASAARLRFRTALWIGSLAFAALAVLWAWTDLSELARKPVEVLSPFGSIEVAPTLSRFTPQLLFDFTARLPHFVRQFAAVPQIMLTAAGCAMLMIAAHLMSVWQVVAHVRDVRALAEQYNAIAKARGLAAVHLPRNHPGLSVGWLAAMVGLAVLGAWWAVPMMLAAAAQSRYIRSTGRSVRLEFAAVVQEQIGAMRPQVAVPIPAPLRGKCSRPGCEEPKTPGARFCPRCGQSRQAVCEGAYGMRAALPGDPVPATVLRPRIA